VKRKEKKRDREEEGKKTKREERLHNLPCLASQSDEYCM
jgi:hypothetical protein